MKPEDMVMKAASECEDTHLTTVDRVVSAIGIDMSVKPSSDLLVVGPSMTAAQILKGLMFSKIPRGVLLESVETSRQDAHLAKLINAVNPRPKKIKGDL